MLKTLTALFASSMLTAAAGAAEVGVADFTFPVPQRGAEVRALLWYPAGDGGVIERIGDNAVFEGVDARRGAAWAAGRRKLILLSHGAGGNAANLGWLATRLAEQGYVVAAPDHPGSTSGDSRPETNVKIWQRPQDMSALISALRASSYKDAIEWTHVGAVGFSMGGYTALALGGARADAKAFAAYCDAEANAPDCVWFAKGNRMIPGHVDLHQIDAAAYDAGHRDPRVTIAVAIDPAIAQAYDAQSLAAMTVPVLAVNLGEGDEVRLGVRAGKIAAAIPGAQYHSVAAANHFTFLAPCKPDGAKIIEAEGDDPVCAENGQRLRRDMHEEIAGRIIGFLAAW